MGCKTPTILVQTSLLPKERKKEKKTFGNKFRQVQ
jgi:hypothetical protein